MLDGKLTRTAGSVASEDRKRRGVRHEAGETDQPRGWHRAQVARSDWYEHAVEKLAIGSYLITPVYLPTARRPGRPRSGT